MSQRKSSRLSFTEDEYADPKLKKVIQKADKAADKLDKAEVKIPKKTVKVKERTVDPKTGKVTVSLKFEEIDKKKPTSKLTHAVAAAPVHLLSNTAHREVRESEKDNVGVEAAHKGEEAAEYSVCTGESAYHSHKLKPYREAAHAEAKADKANINALYKQSIRDNPQAASNPVSKWQQKQAIKKQYAANKAGKTASTTKKTAENTAKAAKKTAQEAKKAGEFIARNKKTFLIIGGIGLVIVLLLNIASSCSVLLQGGFSGVGISTYPCEDGDMLAAEAQYCGMEADLQNELDNYEVYHSGYDEYRFDLDDIEHDPYVLISMLTALQGGEWTISDVQGNLDMLFDKQYIITETVTTETRYRTETRTGSYSYIDPNTGELITEYYEYDVQVPCTYYICNVELENFDLSHVPVYIMSQDQLSMYAMYMATLGNRPDLFPGSEYIGKYINGEYEDYDIPPEALEDEVFAAMIEEAEKYLGYPYVWGGSSPSTSFDCSGFVSWVINHSGWDVGRLGTQGLLNICTRVSSSNAKPGDLIFFQGTYDTTGASHVAIYVGNGMMIHCGDPIQYTSINTSYWQAHFLAFGRLPGN